MHCYRVIELRCFLLVLLLATGGSWAGQMYRWTDASGRTHFSDRPPPADASTGGVQQSELPQARPIGSGEGSGADSVPGAANSGAASPGAASTAERTQNQQRLLRALQEERQAKQQARAKEKQQVAEREQRCKRARDQLARYQQAAIYRNDENGQRRFLEGAERQAVIDEAQQSVERWCG